MLQLYEVMKNIDFDLFTSDQETLKVLITSLYSLYQSSQQPIPNDLIALFKSVSK